MKGVQAAVCAVFFAASAAHARDLVVGDDPDARAAFEAFLASARTVANFEGMHCDFTVTCSACVHPASCAQGDRL